MTAPSFALVSLEDTPWYHCVCRCVRRAFLCGEDHVSGLNFAHRCGWIIERIQQLAAMFAIDVAAYAVMSNHYHIVVRIDRERALGWSLEEVLRRWTALFTGPLLASRYLSDSRTEMTQAEINTEMTQAEINEVEALAEVYPGAAARFVLVHAYSQRAHRPPGQCGGRCDGAFLGRSLQESGPAR